MMTIQNGDFSPRKLSTDAPRLQPVTDRLARLERRLAEAEAQRDKACTEYKAAPNDRYLHDVCRANELHVVDCQRAVNMARGGRV